MTMPGNKMRMVLLSCLVIAVLGAWALIVYNEKQAAVPAVVHSPYYDKILEKAFGSKKEKGDKPGTVSEAATDDRAEDSPQYEIRRAQSRENLCILMMAMRQYAETHGKLPPAIVRDKEGEPLYSWRVLLLPYLDRGEEVYR